MILWIAFIFGLVGGVVFGVVIERIIENGESKLQNIGEDEKYKRCTLCGEVISEKYDEYNPDGIGGYAHNCCLEVLDEKG